MSGKRYSMNAGRTTKQGQQINVGKDGVEYQTIVGTIHMNEIGRASCRERV